jgi:PASTA domain
MQEPPRRRALWPWLVITLVLVIAGAIGALLAVRANDSETTARAAPVLTVAAAPRQEQQVRAASATSVTVPDVRGEELPDAQEEIREAGLVADQRKVRSSLPKETVVAQSPAPGADAERGDHVVLTVSQGSKPPGHEDKDKRGHGHGPKNRNR